MGVQLYPIIGGPLDGQKGNYSDFQRAWGTTAAGIYHQHQGEYVPYNRGARNRAVPTMIWLHKSLLERT